MAEQIVEVVRGTVVESRHRVHAAVVDAAGLLRASAGDPEMVTFIRSAAKPFQALPVIAEGAMERFGITLEEISVICGSHSGEARHVDAVTSILRRIGLEIAMWLIWANMMRFPPGTLRSPPRRGRGRAAAPRIRRVRPAHRRGAPVGNQRQT